MRTLTDAKTETHKFGLSMIILMIPVQTTRCRKGNKHQSALRTSHFKREAWIWRLSKSFYYFLEIDIFLEPSCSITLVEKVHP